ncbi:D-ribitol-5-phosphate cytidylyltransferase isoform X2 [Protopterus annectens]|nr:D-ribitol-5-phosphate cytidylyltransferase isoform X2 [Protopterus annectens]
MERNDNVLLSVTEQCDNVAGTACPSEDAEHFEGVNFSVSAVLPAAGCGERMGVPTPKQFCDILTRPLISYTMQAFEKAQWIKDIVVVVARENTDFMKSVVCKYGHQRITLVEGGSTRHRSIFLGLKAFTETQSCLPSLSKPKVVIIHDAVRPFVEEDLLSRVAIAAHKSGAAGAIRPLVSTVIAASLSGFLDHSLERARYRASEMPQAFLFDIIYEAYLCCSDSDFEYGTECLHLAQQYCNSSAKLIEGPSDLWKVTYKRDLYAAESLFKEMLTEQVWIFAGTGHHTSYLGNLLQDAMQATVKTIKVVSTGIHGNLCLKDVLSVPCYNFVCIATNSSSMQEVKWLTMSVVTANISTLYPVVVVTVHLDDNLGRTAGANIKEDPGGFRHLAKELKPKNVLLYGLLIQGLKGSAQMQESVAEASVIINALIKERSPALTGQLLVA